MLDATLKVDQLERSGPVALELTAGSGDCAALAERFGWIGVSSLAATLEAKAVAGGAYDIVGRIEASITQRCRVTGNPVPETVAIDVHERFAAASGGDGADEIDPMAVSVEIIEGGVVPVGEMVAQLVGLEASAWPRDPEAAAPASADEAADSGHPFASLAELRKKH